MSPLEITLRIVAGIVFVLSNAFFVAIEFALTRLRQFKEEDLPDTPGARKGWELTNELEINLTGCQVGISLTTLLLGVITEPALTTAVVGTVEFLGGELESHRWIGLTLAIVVLNLIHKIWGEQAPTYLGVERPLEVCSALGVPFSWWVRIVYPVIIFGDGLAKWTLRLFGVEVTRSWTHETEKVLKDESKASPRSTLRTNLIELMQESGVGKDRRTEVVNALDIASLAVTEVMVPRDRIRPLYVEEDLEESLQRISRSAHSRYPLVKGSVENFVGSLYTPQLLANVNALQESEMTLEELAHPGLCLSEEKTVSEAIDTFQDEQQEIALIRDADGRTVGLLTLTDALEAIVGQCEDPLDRRFSLSER